MDYMWKAAPAPVLQTCFHMETPHSAERLWSAFTLLPKKSIYFKFSYFLATNTHLLFLSDLSKWQWEIFRLWLESWLIDWLPIPVFSGSSSGDFAQPLRENFLPAQWRIVLVVQNTDVATFHGYNEVLTAPAETSTLHLSLITAWLPFRAVGKQAKSLMCSARAALSSPAAAVQGITSCSCWPWAGQDASSQLLPLLSWLQNCTNTVGSPHDICT